MKFFKWIFLTGLLLPTGTIWAQTSVEESLKQHVKVLTADSLEGRGAGTIGEQKAGAYISRCFESYGLDLLYPQGIQDFSVIGQKGDTIQSQNIVAVLTGSDPRLREEYIVVGAHYDHLGKQRITINGRDSLTFYPGADDNASGVALLLELAKAAVQQSFLFKRSIVFVGFGAEEIGLIGSWYFANRAFEPIAQTVFMMNLDMLGRSGSSHPLFAYTIQPQVDLEAKLKLLGESPLSIQPKITSTDYFPSDHKNFFLKNIPSVLFTSGLHPEYHSSRDRADLLDYSEMERRMVFIYSFLVQLAGQDQKPTALNNSLLEETGMNQKIYSLAEVDKRPKFQHGDEEQFLQLWVNKYVKYPEAAVSQGIQGRVMIQFIIEINGSVSNAEVLKSVDPLLDDEALRVVAASPKWKPAVRNGKEVRVKYIVPVYFVLKKTR